MQNNYDRGLSDFSITRITVVSVCRHNPDTVALPTLKGRKDLPARRGQRAREARKVILAAPARKVTLAILDHKGNKE